MKDAETLGLGAYHVTDYTANQGSAEAGRNLLVSLEGFLQRKGLFVQFTNYEYTNGHNQTQGWRFDIEPWQEDTP